MHIHAASNRITGSFFPVNIPWCAYDFDADYESVQELRLSGVFADSAE